MSQTLDVEKAVRERYAEGAKRKVEELCCPVSYNQQYLQILPQEIIERDYGCGDPSQYLKPGETVLDLGSGGGKICYIAAQVVGAQGRVIGVDMNTEMLALARKYQHEIGQKLGFHNVEFRRGRIQDLALDMEKVEAYLKSHPIHDVADLTALEEYTQHLRQQQPLVLDNSVDVIVSNCVLNLVKSRDKKQLFGEMFRVLKRGGRVVISDIVSDEPATETIKNDPELWSGCIAGAFQEQKFLKAFEEAGFYGIQILKRDENPWQTIDGIEFRSVTVSAYKGKQGPCWETNKAVIYKGPWSQVKDDDNHTYFRGAPMAVCEKTFQILTREPYAQDFVPILPRQEIPLDQAKPFDCSADTIRHPRQTKGQDYHITSSKTSTNGCCEPGSCC